MSSPAFLESLLLATGFASNEGIDPLDPGLFQQAACHNDAHRSGEAGREDGLAIVVAGELRHGAASIGGWDGIGWEVR